MITAVAFLALLASPSPAPSSTPAVCDRDAAVIQKVLPSMPNSAREMGIRTARVVVVVNVNPDGSVKSENIQTSAGISAIDYAALVAARQSTYSPKTVDCRPVLGTYLFEVTVSSQ